MGSPANGMPPADHPDLVLAESTKSELQHVWSLHHPMWGPALRLEDYLAREEFLMTVPLAKNGGVTHWILTDRNAPPDHRPIYASCESLRKRALASRPGPDGPALLQDGIAHGIASVFTNPEYRGKGYASRMMKELGPRLAEWSEGRKEPKEGGPGGGSEEVTRSLFSVLYSDIGKEFYAKNGWAAFESTHLCFKPAAAGTADTPPSRAKPLGYHDLAMLCHLDEKILRGKMQQRARGLGSGGQQVCAALLPDLDQFLWHLMREDFMTKHIFHKTPTVRGASYGEPGRRIWAVWTRGYYGGLEKIEGNTFHILRFVVEDEEACPEEYMAEGFKHIIQLAQAEAAEWRSFDIQMWNPSQLLRNAAEKSGLEYTFVDREKDSIASLMWYGAEPTETVDWVANEKFAWC
ncbi:hypothetical protein VMCG_09235 [Cytospora schulzeri]|uniref:LYC1 C-terminal domain-containing protein n=1 Tax=Cytospora schulzeri TaxID=448051 RepID=A0A423VKZ6_9PEZI|nr:hypothetical protein VMCG_09235 [Valsa malicola]